MALHLPFSLYYCGQTNWWNKLGLSKAFVTNFDNFLVQKYIVFWSKRKILIIPEGLQLPVVLELWSYNLSYFSKNLFSSILNYLQDWKIQRLISLLIILLRCVVVSPLHCPVVTKTTFSSNLHSNLNINSNFSA